MDLRRLSQQDIGRVFLRPDRGDTEGYLILLSLGPPPHEGPSFITFKLADGKIATVGDTGHFNGPYYLPVNGIAPEIIAQVRARWEAKMATWRQELDETCALMPRPVPISIPPQTTREASICPLCFILYPISKVGSESPMCPDCQSEAITIEVEPLDSLLARCSDTQLRELLARWNAAEGFKNDYKALKRTRIEAIIRIREAMDGKRKPWWRFW